MSQSDDSAFFAKIDNNIRQYPEVVTLVLAIIGIFVLAYSASNEWGGFAPQEIKLSELEQYEGMTVRAEATVTDAYHLSSGPWIVDIEDGSTNETIVLFANSLNFIPKTGDVLEITGESARYKGQMEIISQANQVEVISKWNEDTIAVSDIANDPAYYEGKTVTVRTYVKSSPTTSYNTTSFNVGDTYENLRIETEETTELPVMITGDYVEITGTLRFDTYWFSYQIVLEDETHKVEIVS